MTLADKLFARTALKVLWECTVLAVRIECALGPLASAGQTSTISIALDAETLEVFVTYIQI